MTKNEQIKNNMDEKEYDLLMKDLCGRLPYGVKANVSGWDEEKQEEVNIPLRVYSIDTDGYLRFDDNDYGVNYYGIEHCALFLRPLSSMTDEEREELKTLCDEDLSEFAGHLMKGHGLSRDGLYMFDKLRQLDWLNKHHFDFRDLIPKGLALEAKEGMYNN